MMTHRLQAEFASADGEARFVDGLHELVTAGTLDEADAVLAAEIDTLETPLGETMRALGASAVELTGWPELADAISAFEGEPITGIAIGMANDLDLAFEKGQQHSSYLMLGMFTDEAFAWSEASRADIHAQLASDVPAWAGSEEDIEVYLEIEGLAQLNTALIHHKHRFFLRDGDPEQAPLGYVEYVLGCWLRAVRFHQAVAAQVAEHGLPGNIPVVSGTVELKPEVAAVHMAAKAGAVEQVQFASLLGAKPKRTAEIIDFSASNIRQKVAAAQEQPAAAPVERQGFLARMFGRR